MAAFENELGAQPPLGFFDPLGLVADGDQEKFDRLRYVEIKHGRISMLAVVGYLVAEAGTLIIHFLGELCLWSLETNLGFFFISKQESAFQETLTSLEPPSPPFPTVSPPSTPSQVPELPNLLDSLVSWNLPS